MVDTERLEMFGFPDPDDIGQSEYRAMHECITDALASQDEDNPDDSPTELIRGILAEFGSWVRELSHLIDQQEANNRIAELAE